MRSQEHPAFLRSSWNYAPMIPCYRDLMCPCSRVPAFLRSSWTYAPMNLCYCDYMNPCSCLPAFPCSPWTYAPVRVCGCGDMVFCSHVLCIYIHGQRSGWVCGLMVMYFTQVMLGQFFHPEPSVTLTLVLLPKFNSDFLWTVVAHFVVVDCPPPPAKKETNIDIISRTHHSKTLQIT